MDKCEQKVPAESIYYFLKLFDKIYDKFGDKEKNSL